MNALILIDLQNDFMPGGSLPVPQGDQVIPVANRVQDKFELVVATQDWHPSNHGSFAANHPGKQVGDVIELGGLRQILWPVHCVQNTAGAAFVDGLDVKRVQRVFQKGTAPGIDSYSGFFDNAHRRATGLGDYLRHRGVDRVYITGLATDYCVKFSALDAIELGFETFVIEDCCRGVNVKPGDSDAALEQMKRAGARVIRSESV
jgi:nicotinamidase/pyrazinamidase